MIRVDRITIKDNDIDLTSTPNDKSHLFSAGRFRGIDKDGIEMAHVRGPQCHAEGCDFAAWEMASISATSAVLVTLLPRADGDLTVPVPIHASLVDVGRTNDDVIVVHDHHFAARGKRGGGVGRENVER